MTEGGTRAWWKIALATVPAIMIAGSASGWLSNSGFGNSWFDALAKPAFMPPGWAFGLVWPILYAMLGIALAMVLAAPPLRARRMGLILFAVQLALNFAWSPIFFAAHALQPALLTIVAIGFLGALCAVEFWRVRAAAGLLLLPYLAWLLFATALNAAIIKLNPDAGTLPLW